MQLKKNKYQRYLFRHGGGSVLNRIRSLHQTPLAKKTNYVTTHGTLPLMRVCDWSDLMSCVMT